MSIEGGSIVELDLESNGEDLRTYFLTSRGMIVRYQDGIYNDKYIKYLEEIFMKTTKEMILEKELWAGLNKPGIEIEDADIVIFGQAFDKAASVRKGAVEGPRHIREIIYSITPTTEDFELIEDVNILDLGDFDNQNQEELFKEVKEKVIEIVKAGKFFTMLGGDHSVSIPIYQALNESLDDNFGIIHIDAHFDLNDELAGSNLSHGCPARRATELEMVNSSDNLYFVGIRSIEVLMA